MTLSDHTNHTAEAKQKDLLDFQAVPESWSGRIGGITAAFVFLGLAGRLIRYLLCFPLWPDETFLAANFLDGKFSGLVGALDYHQVAPLFFLWAEQLIVNILGFTEYALRLFPFLAGVASVILFYRLAAKLTKGSARLLATAIFAVSYYPIRHSAEVKPYSIDLLVSVVFLVLAVEWWSRPKQNRPLRILTLFAPAAVGLSFPAVFVGGAVSLGVLLTIWKYRIKKAMLPWAAYSVALAASFLVIYAVSTGIQYKEEKWLSGPHAKTADFNVDSAWVKTFPPRQDPGKLIAWLAKIHTGMLFAYPNGGRNGGSALTLILFIAGAVILARRKGWNLLIFFIAPFLLALIAAALHRYPYGYNTRFNLYFAPVICLPAGLGAARVISLIRKEKPRLIVAVSFLSLLAIFGIGNIVLDLIRPYKQIEDVNSRRFAEQFWKEESEDAELVCAFTDLGKDFFPRLWYWGHSSRYLCNQALYSPHHQNGLSRPRWDLISEDHPLKVVIFSVPARFEPYAEKDEEAWQDWMRKMKKRYRLRNYKKHEINANVPSHHETYEIYEFIPK